MGIEASKDIKGLEKEVNRTARKQFRGIMRKAGETLYVPTRLALRFDGQYPYRFGERKDLSRDTSTQGINEVISKDREEGLYEARELAKNAPYEQSWIHVPRENLWIDDTIETGKADTATTIHLRAYLTHLYPEVEMVHTHPDALKSLDIIHPNVRKNWLIESAKPSNVDLVSYKKFVAGCNPDSIVVASVVSHYGVTSVKINDNGKKAEGFTMIGQEHEIDPYNNPIQETKKAIKALQQTYVDWDKEVPIFDMTFTPFEKE